MSSLSVLRRRPFLLNCSFNQARRAPYRSNGSVSTTNSSAGGTKKPLSSILIANRGEIALRVRRTASDYGIRTTTVYTDPDAHSQHALSSPFAINLGETSEYLNGDKIIEVAKREGCEGVHPGYGFLSENSKFARACADAGLVFIGPPPDAIEAMGNKSRSKEIMTAAGVPCIPGYHGANQDPARLKREAALIGYPVLLKAVKGGGGKGMRICQTAEDFDGQLESAKTEARNSFGDDVMLVEKYITTPRHIEVQVFADAHGHCVALGERDCSVQRRHQKILEESPAPHLADGVRKDLWEKARAAAAAVGYRGAGTVEFIFDNESGGFYFMEMNTRLQVEHPVTEMVTGEDLVRWQIIVADGGELPLGQEEIEKRIAERGAAVEARIYAENPDMNFMPDSGKLIHLRPPPTTPTVRVDAGFVEGDEISPFYDPMIAKLIVRGPDRAAALQKLRAALEEYEVVGPATNIDFLKRLCVSPAFVAGDVETGYIEKHAAELFAAKVVTAEVYVQAALGVVLQQQHQQQRSGMKEHHVGETSSFPATVLGFGQGFQTRTVHLSSESASASFPPSSTSSSSHSSSTPSPTSVTIHQKAPSLFDITVHSTTATPQTYRDVTSTYRPHTKTLTSHFAHTRLDSTVVFSSSSFSSATNPPSTTNDAKITLFTRGQKHTLTLTPPPWTRRLAEASSSYATGGESASAGNAVVAPMPCKILRVDVAQGERIRPGQVLVVIESMKMETVIRCPAAAAAPAGAGAGAGKERKGENEMVVTRVGVAKGDVCKAGSLLVAFERAKGSESGQL